MSAVRERGPAAMKWSRCDSCGTPAPPVVGPILLGIERWATFELDGEHGGRGWRAAVLLCRDCAPRMAAFVASGGRAGQGPKPPPIVSNEGGFYAEPEWTS